MEEFEVKFTDVDPIRLEERLLLIGGRKVFDRIFRRVVFDFPDLRLDKEAAWVRVRDEGEQATMSFKQRLGWTPDSPVVAIRVCSRRKW